MRQNWKLILKLLVFIRDKVNGKELLPVPSFCKFEPEVVEYHLRLCEEEGFVVSSKTEPLLDAPEGSIMGMVRITAAGHREIERRRRRMSAVQVPPLKIQGIKTKAVPFIRNSVEWSGSGRWIEPFVGSAVVPFNIKPERALLGDANPHLVRFYAAIQAGTVTRATVRAFLEREGARLLRDGQAHFYRVRERFNDSGDPHDFLFLNRACFNGLVRFNRKGRFNTPFCRKPERFRSAYITKICNQVQRAADCMTRKEWEFVCTDWSDILSEAGEGDFVYCDPPYAGRSTDYFNSWTDKEAEQLEAGLKALPCPFIYSMWSENKYRKNNRLHEAFSDYEIKTFSHFYHLGATENLRNGMTEALVVG